MNSDICAKNSSNFSGLVAAGEFFQVQDYAAVSIPDGLLANAKRRSLSAPGYQQNEFHWVVTAIRVKTTSGLSAYGSSHVEKTRNRIGRIKCGCAGTMWSEDINLVASKGPICNSFKAKKYIWNVQAHTTEYIQRTTSKSEIQRG